MDAGSSNGHVQIVPGVAGGRPVVAGHRIRVQDIVVWHERCGLSPDEIVGGIYPQLTLAEVYAALAYYHDHRDAIRADLADEDAVVAQARAATPSKLLARLARRGASDAAISPG